jgi:hypothetical protein
MASDTVIIKDGFYRYAVCYINGITATSGGIALRIRVLGIQEFLVVVITGIEKCNDH